MVIYEGYCDRCGEYVNGISADLYVKVALDGKVNIMLIHKNAIICASNQAQHKKQ